jgi:hypothetical protein
MIVRAHEHGGDSQQADGGDRVGKAAQSGDDGVGRGHAKAWFDRVSLASISCKLRGGRTWAMCVQRMGVGGDEDYKAGDMIGRGQRWVRYGGCSCSPSWEPKKSVRHIGSYGACVGEG